NAAVQSVAPAVEAKEIAIETALPPDIPSIRGDPARLQQITWNLLSNAVKFTDAGGRVTLSVTERDGALVLVVADNGIGMAPEDLERVMEPFVQADTRLSRKYEGTGLGLPLTKALVTAHGGTLVLTSTPNQGTTATVTFPAERVVRDIKAAMAIEEALRRG
ncbi:MAG TPA: ATP-binding protein, partial [Candidatus Omnitrophota bacterium]|nr:ATP-binding protein [Candidatus Omnitrophota bacterium]